MKSFKLESFIENAKSLNVLYVEDSAGTRLQVGHFLKSSFKEVIVVSHPEVALKMFNSGYYDLILTGASLPDMDVSHMCRRIKQIAPKKPIVILSNKKDYDELVKLINIGISGFIEIPTTQRKIAIVLSRVVRDINDYNAIFRLQDDLLENCEVHNIKQSSINNKEINLDKVVDGHQTIDSKLSAQDVELLRMTHDHNNITSAKEFIEELDNSALEDFEELNHIHRELENAIVSFDTEQSVEKLNDIAKLFGEIASVLNFMLEFADFSNAIRSFATFLDGLKDDEIVKTSDIMKKLIPTIYDDLASWRKHIFELQDANDIHYLDSSLFSSILQFQLSVTSELKGVEEDDSDSGELEFF